MTVWGLTDTAHEHGTRMWHRDAAGKGPRKSSVLCLWPTLRAWLVPLPSPAPLWLGSITKGGDPHHTPEGWEVPPHSDSWFPVGPALRHGQRCLP